MKKSSRPHKKANSTGSTFRERFEFALWLAAKTVGTSNSREFAAVLKKGPAQVSKWVNENPRPNWDNIKLIAATVGVNANWLDEPTSDGAIEPPEFPEWLASRRSYALGDARRAHSR